ncbi:MAG: hypothetical protein AAFV62_05530 [Pseudomonadota bacterium]
MSGISESAPASGAEPQRYSDQRMADDFTVYILLSETLQFDPAEIVAAFNEDFPGLAEISVSIGGENGGKHDGEGGRGSLFDTGDVSIAMLQHGGARGEERVTLISGPTRFDADLTAAYARAHLFRDAKAVVDASASFLSVSVSGTKGAAANLASRYRQARLATCLSAVFAKLPICTAVYFPSGDVIARPEMWVKAAETAAQDQWPLGEWFSYEINLQADRPDGRPTFSCGLVGMAAFNGHEVALASAPVGPDVATQYVMGAAYLLLAGGSVFKDSDTIGLDGSGLQLRIRLLPEGVQAQTDTWILVHPESPLDEAALFGAQTHPPAPPGVDARKRPEKGFMTRLLGGSR